MSLATAGILLGPSVLKYGAKAFGIGKNAPTKYEQELFRMADIFGSEASVPLTESRAFKSGMSVLSEQDEKNRSAINNQSAVTGATDEAKLSHMQNSNENLNRGMQRLLNFAAREKNRFQGLKLQTLGAGSQLRQQRKAQDIQNLNTIFDPLQSAASAYTMAGMMGFGELSNEEKNKRLKQLGTIMDTPGWSGM